MNTTFRIGLITGLAVLSTSLGGCTTDNDRNAMAEQAMRGSDVAWSEETGDFNYLYRYFPNDHVFQSVFSGTWYWEDNQGSWRWDTDRPDNLVVKGHYELIELPTRQPWTRYQQVAAQYPDIETLEARALAYDAYLGRSSAANGGVFATVPGNDRPD
ncbi:MAG: hypothetical protein AB8G96_03655 [Phycisphaerales bacterium]